MAVGRLVPVKDFHRLVRIVAKVHERVPDFELVIVGEGYERDSITSLIDELDAGEYITLAGRISDDELRELYRRAWMAVSASVREGWGMTLTEAAACGTPSVATDIAGHSDAVSADRSGILRSADPDLVDAMVAVATDPELRRALNAGALERAAEFTWEAAAVSTFEILANDAVRRSGRTPDRR